MASGRPVLLFAPENIAITEYAKSEQWGYVLSENNPDTLKQLLLRIIHDTNGRMEYSRQAVKTARINHDMEKIQKEFLHFMSIMD
jgi:hypothetical protein